MKHATFKDFVREAYYHGIMEAAAVAKDGVDDETERNTWVKVEEHISKKEFAEAEALITQYYESITLVAVITFWPTEQQMNEAYNAVP